MKDTAENTIFNNQTITTVVDATGLICPEPVMLLHGAVRDVQEGQLVKIIATDPSTKKDISNFCEFLNHTLEQLAEDGDKLIFVVRKGSRNN